MALLIPTKVLYDPVKETYSDILYDDKFNLNQILSKISAMESRICSEFSMPDQELFYVIVTYKKGSDNEKTEIRKKTLRQSLFFIPQEEYPCFSEKGHCVLKTPEEILVENDGMGGVMKSLIASNVLKVL